MSTDTLRSSNNSKSPFSAEPQLIAPDKSFSYLQLTCSYCKFKKRKCDGGNPCSNCKKYKQTCAYYADNDRRRRKYHTDYINYLEGKSDVLTKFINEFVKDSPELSNAFQQKLSQMVTLSQIKADEKINRNDEKNYNQLDDHLLQILDEAKKLKLDEEDTIRVMNSKSLLNHSNEYDDLNLNHQISPYSEATSSTFDSINDEESNPLTMNGLNIVFRDESFRAHLTDSFEENFSAFFHCFTVILPEVRRWKFSSSVPSKQLLMCSIFAVGAVYSGHPYALRSRKAFIAEAEYIAVDACRYPLDIYLVMGLTLLSMYELGMGNDSISYLFDSMSCSLTQHMGLHISYDQTGDSKSANYAPRASPIRSSILWGICLQDRIITSLCNVQACIHFKRIIAPAYSTVLGPENKYYISELSFAAQTRLWYIFDRFMDQICSENGDIGDTHQRTTLLETALSSLSEFKNSLPAPLMLTNENNNKFVMMLHYTYHCLICQFHKAFVKITKDSSQKLIANAAIAAKILARYQKSNPLEILPYYASYLIYSSALTYLIVLTKHKNEIYTSPEQETYYNNFRSYFSNCVTALKALSKIWKRSKKDLNILKNLCIQEGIYIPELSDTVKEELDYSILTSETQTPDGIQEAFTSAKFSFTASPETSSNAASEFESEPIEFDPTSFFNNFGQQSFIPTPRTVPIPAAHNQQEQPQQQQQHQHQPQHQLQQYQQQYQQQQHFQHQQQQHNQQQQQQQQQQHHQHSLSQPQWDQQAAKINSHAPAGVQQPTQCPIAPAIQPPIQQNSDASHFIPAPPMPPTSNRDFSLLQTVGELSSETDGFVEAMNQFYPSFSFNNVDLNTNLDGGNMNHPAINGKSPSKPATE